MKSFLDVFVRIVLFIIAYLVISGTLQAVAVALTSDNFLSDGLSALKFSTFQHFAISFSDCVGVSFIVYFFLKFDKMSFRSLGLKFNLNQMLQAFILGSIFIVLFFLFFNLSGQIVALERSFNLKEIGLTTAFLFFAALSEELLFRGYMMKMSEKFVGKNWALVISSFIFAVFHLLNPNLSFVAILEIFLAGIALGYTYYKTENIWFVTVMHFAWNFSQTILGFNVSGQDFYSVFEFSKLNENLITGGKFGFEGSLFSLLTEVFTVFIISKYNKINFFAGKKMT